VRQQLGRYGLGWSNWNPLCTTGFCKLLQIFYGGEGKESPFKCNSLLAFGAHQENFFGISFTHTNFYGIRDPSGTRQTWINNFFGREKDSGGGPKLNPNRGYVVFLSR